MRLFSQSNLGGRYIAVNPAILRLIALSLLLVAVGCNSVHVGSIEDATQSTEATEATADNDNESVEGSVLLYQATAWFLSEYPDYFEIIQSEVHNDIIVFLTGAVNPGTDNVYGLLQTFSTCKIGLSGSHLAVFGFGRSI